MPHPGERSLNDPAMVRARVQRQRKDHSGTYPSVQVGTKLAIELLDAYEAVQRMREAGWAIADDGDPYEVTR